MISLRKIILTAFFVYEDNTYSLLKNQTILKIMKSPEHLPSRYNYSTYFYKLVQSSLYVFVFIILHKTNHNTNTLLQSIGQEASSKKMLIDTFCQIWGWF